jgi:hypothetical protein
MVKSLVAPIAILGTAFVRRLIWSIDPLIDRPGQVSELHGSVLAFAWSEGRFDRGPLI